VHDWYRFVLSYPPHLVRQYCEKFRFNAATKVLDPFCGTGTTLVEAKLNRIPSVGCDAHPFAALVSRVKTNWQVDADRLHARAKGILARAEGDMIANGLERLSFETDLAQDQSAILEGLTPDEQKVLPEGFLSERPLRRLLLLRRAIAEFSADLANAEREFLYLPLAHAIANGAGNFGFGPEIYRKKAIDDYDVLGHYAKQVWLMIADLRHLQEEELDTTEANVIEEDARTLGGVEAGFAGVITSPPYPNEKDYTRTTRVESLILGLISDKASLRRVKEGLLRSNTRNIFVDDRDRDEVAEFESIQRVCTEIEERRIELKKTSGFERLYHKVVSHYFGGMRRHFRALRPRLARGARLAYVVGDQLSFLMVHVPTARFLGEVAQAEGFEFVGCDLWRERVGTKVRNDLEGRRVVRVREEVLLLKNP
jgi:DNA modification methylase